MTDTSQVIFEWLTAASALQDSIASQCWTPIAPKGWKGDSAAIVFTEQGPSSHASGATHTATFTFKCYGGTADPTDARTVAGLLWDRLHHANFTATAAGRIMSAQLTGGGGTTTEPDTGFPVYFASYQVTIEE